ncbi:DUF2141 domain-containing protein [Altericroceibacterium endophyticum]|uniref:DUF2141 domain-containing protein n=1 Tax=Altericroceibacterium endophyticum TaxID=1808508 RepID=A0A6I4T6B4_9SPHN|nr:DUF2141 domain-containing protein [Altericroceibacterium endophyticum]MXO65543.1 DUF2141 domain-containing protein [Altericroceibacterium endophyticum]
MNTAFRKAAKVLTLAAAATLPFALPAAAQAKSPPAGCTGDEKTGTWLNVVAEGMRSSDGLLAMTVYPDKSSEFLAKGGSLDVGRIKAQKGTTRGCVFLPKPGVYVIALYHDENGNRKFDRTGLGLPAEGYGFSNNPSTIAGLPTFSSVRIAVPKTGLTTRITMKYP